MIALFARLATAQRQRYQPIDQAHRLSLAAHKGFRKKPYCMVNLRQQKRHLHGLV